MPSDPTVGLVRACQRDGTGGSPTAVVVEEAPLTDAERRRVPVEWGVSHAVYARVHDGLPEPIVDLRFFTAEGELPACGHGTVAALVLLAARARARAGSGSGAGAGAGTSAAEPYRATLRTAGRSFPGRARVDGDRGTGLFDPGPVALRDPSAAERALVLPALGLAPDEPGQAVRVAGVGRERILVPVSSRSALAALTPDLDRLRAACDRLGLLGAYVYSPPSSTGSLAARMFAPSIGVPEDIANANSTACLAAHLAGREVTDLAVDMGDALGSPARITATLTEDPGPGRPGPRILLGGTAQVLG
ncbi:PhzF family phenazine biosynthesis protein [Streptomyces sp. NPDC085481]|uniref:PhzF family phenazine biosynthesis protein n=1 Tax=Streptomyces sp. NPDC085481 TaxID=3365727 RepID=UPI0037D7C578